MKALLLALAAAVALAPLASAQDAAPPQDAAPQNATPQGASGQDASGQDEVVHERDYDVSALNQGLVAGRLTCDLHFHLTKQGNITWETVVKRLPKLREIFEPAGIQFRVASARLIEIPEAWHTHTPKRGEAPSAERRAFYATPADMKPLAPATERVFKAVVGDTGPGAELSVHFVSLRRVQTGWWERDSEDKWRYETAGTSACSFPPYLFGKNMPARLRGAITISSKGLSSRTFAHELGHKLINVSHEGVGKSPKGEQWGGDDLMIYGRGTRIPSGAAGRFQAERLKRSPFLYRSVAGKREFNPPYQEGGHYWDPVYRISADEALWAEERPERLPARRASPGLKGALDPQAGPR